MKVTLLRIDQDGETDQVDTFKAQTLEETVKYLDSFYGYRESSINGDNICFNDYLNNTLLAVMSEEL